MSINKEKQIEEMRKDIPYLTLDRTVFVGATETKNVSWTLSEEDNKLIAETLIGKGWVKLLENSVVLSKEEYQKDFSSQFNKGYKHGSKETAEKLLSELYYIVRFYYGDSANVLAWAKEKAEKLGVEIKERK